MTELNNITVNISLNGPIDVEKIAEEVKASIRKEIERVGVKVESCCPKPEPLKEAELKVGDYAKVMNYFCLSKFSGIMKVTEINRKSSFPIRAELLDGSDDEVFRKDQLVRASDEEVAEAKRKLAAETERKEAEAKKESERMVLERRCAKIGRKPNEFKKGDIVRVIDASSSRLNTGDIGEIVEIDTDHTPYRVNTAKVTSGNWTRLEQIELITPVEARFDR